MDLRLAVFDSIQMITAFYGLAVFDGIHGFHALTETARRRTVCSVFRGEGKVMCIATGVTIFTDNICLLRRYVC